MTDPGATLTRRLALILLLHVPLAPFIGVPGAIVVYGVERVVGGHLPSAVLVSLSLLLSEAAFVLVLWLARRDWLRALNLYLLSCLGLFVLLLLAHLAGLGFARALVARFTE
jgi:hypothetical protein